MTNLADETSSLEDVLAAVENRAVTVVGDAMIDRYIEGSVSRVSPEAPIPVLRYGSERFVPGGGANVAANVVSLGGRADLVAAVGVDDGATALARLCRESGVDASGLVADPARPTTVKTRLMAQDQQMLRLDQEAVRPLSPEARGALLDAAARSLETTHALVLSDYGKGVLADGVAGELVALARRMGRPTIVDPKCADYARYRGADVVTPNLAELALATGVPVEAFERDEEIVAAARGLVERFELGALLVTLSARGMALVRPDGAATMLPTRAQEVFDVSGAGDTVVAGVALALAADVPLADAATLANHAAGVAVAHLGTARVTAAEVARTLRAEHADSGGVSLPTARRIVERWRAQGLSVGFTNGCFDILHVGHVRLLTAAAATCDRLVVGVNADVSVRRLKGPERPIQTEAARATVLSALSAVDLVTLFEDDTPAALIEALQPDVLIKGADYAPSEIVGASVVEARGGRVVRVPLVEGASTTGIARRIRAGGG